MAVRALGAGTLVDAEGTWPSNYVNFANEEGLLDDVNGIYTATASRLQAATIVANTIDAVMWEKSQVKTTGEITWQKSTAKDTILDDVLKLDKIEDYVVISIDYVNNKVAIWSLLEDTDKDGVYDAGEEVTRKVGDNLDLSSLKLGYAYDGYTDEKGKVMGLWTAEDSKVETVSFDEITKVGSDYIKVMVNGSEKEYDFHMEGTPAAPVYTTYYNTVKEADNTKVVKSEDLFGTIVLKDDEVSTIYLEQYTNAGVVDEVTDTRVKFDTLGGSAYAGAATFKLDDEDFTYFVMKDGKEIKASDIEEDDVLFYYQEGTSKVYHVLVSENVVSGKVTSIGSNYIKIDGKKYTVVTSTTPAFSAAKFGADNEVDAFLNEAGKIVAFRLIDGTSEFAVVSSLEFIRNNKDDIKAQVVLTFTDGTKSDKLTVDVKDADSAYKSTGIKGMFNLNASDEYIVWSGSPLTQGTSAAALDVTDVKDLNTAVKADVRNSILGQIVDYDIDKDEVVIKANADIKAVDAASFTAGASKKYFTATTNGKVYTNSSTKVLSYKVDNDDTYKVNVNVCDIDELDNSTGLVVYFADIDTKTSVVKLAVIDETIGAKASKGTSTGNWALVIDQTASVSKDADYDYEVNVITSEGKEELFYSDASRSQLTYGELKLDGEEITDIASADYNLVTEGSKFIAKEEDGILYLCENAASENTFTDTLVLADNVVYIEYDSVESEYSLGRASHVDFVEVDLADKYDATNANEILYVLTYEFETGAPEVVAIIYKAN